MRYVIKTNKTKLYQFVKGCSGLELPSMKSFEFEKVGYSYLLTSSVTRSTCPAYVVSRCCESANTFRMSFPSESVWCTRRWNTCWKVVCSRRCPNDKLCSDWICVDGSG